MVNDSVAEVVNFRGSALNTNPVSHMRMPLEHRIVPFVRTLCAAAMITSIGCAHTATHAEIRASDLRQRLMVVASDSMEGRSAGSPGAQRAQRYIVRELARLGITPLGENGGYEQSLRAVARKVGPSTLRAGETVLTPWKDFLPIPWAWNVSPSYSATVVFGGDRKSVV